MKRLPITAAKAVAERYNQDQVIMMTWDSQTGLTHVVSYGRTKEHCRQAALGAKLLRKTLGFEGEL